MLIDLNAIIVAYLVPIVLGVTLVVAVLLARAAVNRLGGKPEEDPAARAALDRSRRR